MIIQEKRCALCMESPIITIIILISIVFTCNVQLVTPAANHRQLIIAINRLNYSNGHIRRIEELSLIAASNRKTYRWTMKARYGDGNSKNRYTADFLFFVRLLMTDDPRNCLSGRTYKGRSRHALLSKWTR